MAEKGMMLVVLALGGNALLRRGEPPDESTQRKNVRAAATAIAAITRDHRVVVTHGNGPQVGLLAMQSAFEGVAPYSLDVLGAESAGMIGYLLEEALAAELPGRDTATLLTLVEVSPDDPAFAEPTKPIGPVYGKQESRALAEHTEWRFMPDGEGFRRAIASPRPQRIRGLGAIRALIDAGVILICAGGGGMPVVVEGGGVRGVEAVIDKDFTSAMLAEMVGADALLLLTDVAGVFTDWPHAKAPPLRHATPAVLRRYEFAPGSMGPKVEAACRFVERTGRRAMIGAVEEMRAVVEEQAGTVVLPG